MTDTKKMKVLAGITMPKQLDGKNVGILAGRVDHISLPLKGVRFLGKRGNILDNMGFQKADSGETTETAHLPKS